MLRVFFCYTHKIMHFRLFNQFMFVIFVKKVTDAICLWVLKVFQAVTTKITSNCYAETNPNKITFQIKIITSLFVKRQNKLDNEACSFHCKHCRTQDMRYGSCTFQLSFLFDIHHKELLLY